MRVRTPAVSGKFYPSGKDELINLLHSIHLKEEKKFQHDFKPAVLFGGIVPHAGYVFSGFEAIHFFELVKRYREPFETVVILHPNHNGVGPELALDENDAWATPLGEVEIDTEFRDQMQIEASALAHKFEHSAEVMIPLLQYKLPYRTRILPLAMARQTPDHANQVASELVRVNRLLNRKLLIIASSDFSHYVSPAYGKKMDQMVIDRIEALDVEGIYETVKKNHISVCGFGPIMALLTYARTVNEWPETRILRRGHSGEILESSEVVDYVTMAVYSDIS